MAATVATLLGAIAGGSGYAVAAAEMVAYVNNRDLLEEVARDIIAGEFADCNDDARSEAFHAQMLGRLVDTLDYEQVRELLEAVWEGVIVPVYGPKHDYNLRPRKPVTPPAPIEWDNEHDCASVASDDSSDSDWELEADYDASSDPAYDDSEDIDDDKWRTTAAPARLQGEKVDKIAVRLAEYEDGSIVLWFHEGTRFWCAPAEALQPDVTIRDIRIAGDVLSVMVSPSGNTYRLEARTVIA